MQTIFFKWEVGNSIRERTCWVIISLLFCEYRYLYQLGRCGCLVVSWGGFWWSDPGFKSCCLKTFFQENRLFWNLFSVRPQKRLKLKLQLCCLMDTCRQSPGTRKEKKQSKNWKCPRCNLSLGYKRVKLSSHWNTLIVFNSHFSSNGKKTSDTSKTDKETDTFNRLTKLNTRSH